MYSKMTDNDKFRIEKLGIRYKVLLSDWEVEFILSLQPQQFITPNQKQKLKEIYRNLESSIKLYDLELLSKTNPIAYSIELLRDNDYNTLTQRQKIILKAWDKRSINKGFKLIYQMFYNNDLYIKLHYTQKRRLYKLTDYNALKTIEDKPFLDEVREIKHSLALSPNKRACYILNKNGISGDEWHVIYKLLEYEGMTKRDNEWVLSLVARLTEKNKYLSPKQGRYLLKLIERYEKYIK